MLVYPESLEKQWQAKAKAEEWKNPEPALGGNKQDFKEENF